MAIRHSERIQKSSTGTIYDNFKAICYDDAHAEIRCNCAGPTHCERVSHSIYIETNADAKQSGFNDHVTAYLKNVNKGILVLVIDSIGTKSTHAIIAAGHQWENILPFTYCSYDQTVMKSTFAGINTMCATSSAMYSWYIKPMSMVAIVHDAMTGAKKVLEDMTIVVQSRASNVFVIVNMTERNDTTRSTFHTDLKCIASKHGYHLYNFKFLGEYRQGTGRMMMFPYSFRFEKM